MSQRFFLNDCLPAQTANGVNVATLFRDMIIGFQALHQNKAIDVDQNWTTSDTVDGVTLWRTGGRVPVSGTGIYHVMMRGINHQNIFKSSRVCDMGTGLSDIIHSKPIVN